MSPISRFHIEGPSMLPTFQHGDRVLVWRYGAIRPGDIVVFCKNGMKMVKRAVTKAGDRWVMRGDNENVSTDSRDFGAVEEKSIVGRVVMSY